MAPHIPEPSLHRSDSKEPAVIEAAVALDQDDDREIERKAEHSSGVARETAFVGLTRVQALRKFWRACFFCGFCVFGVMMDGFQVPLPGGVLANRGFINQFGTVTNPTTGLRALNAQHISSWAGMATQYIAGWISDRYGRRFVLWLLTLSLSIGLIIEMVAKTWVHWLISKLFMGLGQGLCQHGILTYMAEIAPAQIRGTMLSTYGWGYALGQLFAAIALQIVNVTDPNNYLKAIYSEWVTLGIWILFIPFVPETPWYYARKEQEDKAKKTMGRIFKNVEGYNIDFEYAIMVEQIEREKMEITENAGVGWKDIFTGVHLRRTFAGVFCLAMQNWSGSSVIFNYTAFFLQQAGIPQPFQATCIVYCILIGAIAISFYTVERFGRRLLILTGGVLCFVFNILIGIFGILSQTSAVQDATLAVICLWVLVYANCFAGTCWTVASEISTPRLRAKTIAFVVSTNAISGAIFNTTVPLMISSSGNGARGWGVKTLFMFAILVAVGTVINYFLLPETKGRTYGEMDELYQARIAPRRMQAHLTNVERTGQKTHNK